MNYNSLIEIGSKANVILRFRGQAKINGKTYEENEPYLFLKDVNVLINYSNQDKSGETDINVIANSDVKPRTVAIAGFPLTRKIVSLLATYKEKEEDKFYEKTHFVTLLASRDTGETEGTIFLTEDNFIDNEIWFVYDKNFEKVDQSLITYNAAQKALISSEFQDKEEYLISFSTEEAGFKYDLNKCHVPYMSMEIQGIGNINKKKKEILMYFDKVSLNSLINFTFIQDQIINVPLQFHIIEDKNNYVVFEGEGE